MAQGTSVSGKFGAAVSVGTPTKTGYTFSSWNPALPAHFGATPQTFTATYVRDGDASITYVLNGGENAATNPASYNIESGTITFAPATRTGYTFAGWYADEACTTQKTGIPAGSTGNVTVYAKWTAARVSYTVKHITETLAGAYDAASPADTESLQGTTGSLATITPKTYPGFTVQSPLPQETIAADGSTVVEVHYARNTITLTFDPAGGTLSSLTKQGKYGESVAAPTPTRAGYAFNGWTPTVQETFTADATYTAQWSAVSGISVTVDAASDIKIERTAGTLTFTTEAGYDTYAWRLDDTPLSATGNTVTLDANLPSGTYVLYVVAKKAAETRSAILFINK